MDIDKQTAPLCKKIQKLQWQIDNAVLSEDQIKEKKEEIAKLKTQTESFGSQLTPLQLTKALTTTLRRLVGILGEQGPSLPGAMYWESHSMNPLTGQLIVRYTVGWPGEELLADKSSAALNKYHLKSIKLIKYKEKPSLLIQSK